MVFGEGTGGCVWWQVVWKTGVKKLPIPKDEERKVSFGVSPRWRD